jgi:hypothetical protein
MVALEAWSIDSLFSSLLKPSLSCHNSYSTPMLHHVMIHEKANLVIILILMPQIQLRQDNRPRACEEA